MTTKTKWKYIREGMVATGECPYKNGTDKAEYWRAGKSWDKHVETLGLEGKSIPDDALAALCQYTPPIPKPRKKKRRTPKEELEGAVQKECQTVLSGYGVLQWRQNTGVDRGRGRFVRYGKPGQPDLMGILPGGRFIGVECKRRKGGKTTDKQKEYGAKILAQGGLWCVANSGAVLAEYLRKELK